MSVGGGGGSSSSSSDSQFGPTPEATQAAQVGIQGAETLGGITQGMYNDLVVGQMLPLMFGLTDPSLKVWGWKTGLGSQSDPGTDPYGLTYASPWGQPGGPGGTSAQGGASTGGIDPNAVFTGGMDSPGGAWPSGWVTPSSFASFGAPGAIMSQAFDPQNALHAQQLGQLQQQIGTQNAMQGIGSTPYGAQVAANALGNFDIDWQNYLLNREITGSEAAMNLYSQALGGGSASSQPLSSGTQSLAQIAMQQQGQSHSQSQSSQASGSVGK